MTDSLPPPPSGDLQLPSSFDDALDIFPMGKQISPALPYGGSRWQVLELPEEDGEENATGVALSPVDESPEHAELHEALDGDELLSLAQSIACGAQLGYGRMAGVPKPADNAPPPPLPPSGDLQLPCSFEDALDIFPLCKPISPDLPYGGSRWQVMELAEEDGEESAMLSAAGVAEAMATEGMEQHVHTHAELEQQARDGDEVLAATHQRTITELSTLWTNGSQPHEEAAYRLLHEGEHQLSPTGVMHTGPTIDESFAAACGTAAADGAAALKKNQVKTPWTKQEDQAILEGVKVHGHKWSKIAMALPCTVPRTDDATRNRWHRLMNKQGRLANERPASGETEDDSPPKRPRPHARAQPTAAQAVAAEEAAGKGGKHGDMWTTEEDLTIDHAVRPSPNPNPDPDPGPSPSPNPEPDQVRMRGLRWKAVAALLPGRTESGCRNRWVRNQEREFAAAGLHVHGAAAVFAALDAARQQEQQEQQQAAMAS